MNASTTRAARPKSNRIHSFKTCRNCLGNGCIHCGERGQVRQRVWTRADVEGARLRAQIFGC